MVLPLFWMLCLMRTPSNTAKRPVKGESCFYSRVLREGCAARRGPRGRGLGEAPASRWGAEREDLRQGTSVGVGGKAPAAGEKGFQRRVSVTGHRQGRASGEPGAGTSLVSLITLVPWAPGCLWVIEAAGKYEHSTIYNTVHPRRTMRTRMRRGHSFQLGDAFLM